MTRNCKNISLIDRLSKIFTIFADKMRLPRPLRCLAMKQSRIVGTMVLTAILLFTSCEHRPLVDPINTHYMKVYINDTIKNITTGFYDPSYPQPEYNFPTVLRAILCNPNTGDYQFERFLTNSGSDENGKYLDGYIYCEAGEYELMVYNWDTEVTQIENSHNSHLAMAYTSLIPTKSGIIYTPPDFLFVAKDVIKVYPAPKVDTLVASNGKKSFEAESIVEAYFFQVPIRNMENVASISAVISGMSWSKMLRDRNFSENSVSLYTNLAKGKKEDDYTYIYAEVNTFGHFPGEDSEIHLIFTMMMTDGKVYTKDIDISEHYKKIEAVENNWILLEEIIDTPEVEQPGGGFNPGVSEWEDIGAEIPI